MTYSAPDSTLAAVLVEHGGELQLQHLPLPKPVEGAAIVKIGCTTLCGTDVELWSGKMSFPGMLPMVLGHEMVGEIVALGSNLTDALGRELRLGDRIGWSEATCGHCYACSVLRAPVGCTHRGYGFLQRSDRPPYATAGLAQYAYVVPGSAKLLIPEEVPDWFASMAGCAAKTVLHAFGRVGGIRPGSKVAIQGSGALGIFATAVASISGAGQVITIGAPSTRLELATRFGATEVVPVDLGSEALVEKVMEMTGGEGADYVFDFAGAPNVGREALEMAAQCGVFAVVGSTAPDLNGLPLGTVMGKELTVVGSINGDISDYFRAIEFYRSFTNRFPWSELVSPPVPLSAASAALRSMAALATVKAVIEPSL